MCLPHAHTITIGDTNVEGGGNLEGDIDHRLVIDELSLDKNEHFAESVIHNAQGSKCSSIVHSVSKYSMLCLVKDFPSTSSSIVNTQL